jgi:heme-degrading monooxygenase HmoA
MEEEFKSFFLNEAVPLLRKHDGLVSIQVGLPREETPREFMMTTTWSSIESLAGYSGDNWREAVIDRREVHLLEETAVYHYYEASI